MKAGPASKVLAALVPPIMLVLGWLFGHKAWVKVEQDLSR